MSATLHDFLQRFSGRNPSTDFDDAMHFFDRFASGRPEDREFDPETMHAAAGNHLAQLPEPQFREAVSTAFANASPEQQQGLVSSLLRAVQNRSVNLGGIFSGGVPEQFTPEQYAQLAHIVRQHDPGAMQDLVREQPWFVKAMGNPVVKGALNEVANRMASPRKSPPSTQRR